MFSSLDTRNEVSCRAGSYSGCMSNKQGPTQFLKRMQKKAVHFLRVKAYSQIRKTHYLVHDKPRRRTNDAQ